MDRVNVIVVRDNARTKAQTSVFDVEVPVLRQMFAEVTVLDSEPVKVDDIGAEDLYGRLELKYKAPDAADAFTRVYPTAGALANAMKRGVDLSNPDDAELPDVDGDEKPAKKTAAKKH